MSYTIILKLWEAVFFFFKDNIATSVKFRMMFSSFEKSQVKAYKVDSFSVHISSKQLRSETQVWKQTCRKKRASFRAGATGTPVKLS